METIKNLLRPGHNQDDQTLYNDQSAGNTTNTTANSKSGLTGEGSHLAGTRDGADVTGTSHSSGLTGQGSHFGSSDNSRLEGNDTLGSTSTTTASGSGARSGAGQREYDPQGNASSRGVTTVGGNQSETYNTSQSTTVGPDSTADTARTATSDNNRSTELGGITGASSATHHGSQPKSASGPHQSDTLNRADPRVDSDNSRTANAGNVNTTSHSVTSDNDRSTALGGITGAASSTHGNHPPNTTSGPHQSDALNRADPRVDSDNSRTSNSGNIGTTGSSLTADNARSTALGGITGATSSTHGNHPPTTTSGPHQSDTLNRLDPRVDSDNSQSTGVARSSDGYSSTTGGSYHTGPIGSAVSGPHQTHTANLLDPNLDNSSSTRREDAIRHNERYGGGAENADNDHGTSARNIAAGTVGLGALGLGSSSHESRFTNQGNSDVQREGHTLASSTMPGSFPESSASSTRQTDTAPQNTSILPDRTQAYSDGNTTTKPGDSDHHYGRDAAIVGGAAGLAGAAYGSSRHSDNAHSVATQQPVGSTVGENLHATEHNRAIGDTHPQTSTTTSTHQSSNVTNTGSSVGHQSTGTTSTVEPHSSSLLNKLDPRISKDQTQDSHAGRNAALGAGALGAGGAAYGASRHDTQDPNTTTSRDTSGLGSSGVGSHVGQTAGPHSSDLANRADPRVDSDRSKEKDHSYGRDAALVGGAGAAGYGASRLHDGTRHSDTRDTAQGAYSSDHSNRGATAATSSAPTSAATHHSHQPHSSTTTTTTTNTSTTTKGPHSSNLANRVDPTVDSDRSKEHGHHYGRDAAVVGAAGTAAYGAHELSQHDQEKMRRLGEEERAKQKQEHEKFVEKSGKDNHHGGEVAAVGAAGTATYGAHELSKHDEEKMRRLGEEERAKQQQEHEKFVEKEHKPTDKHEKKEHKGLFSFLHRDKNKKYTKEEEDDFDREEREYDAQHGVGAGKKAAAAGAAGVGAGTYAAHESHQPQSSTHEQATGSTIGDKLHGTHRNRGVLGDEPFPDGGGPGDGINEVTGQPFESSIVHGQPTIGTDGHHHTLGSTGGTNTSQHVTTSNTGSGLTSGTSTGAVGTNSGVAGNATVSDSTQHDRNRLHKDPPAGHPASQV